MVGSSSSSVGVSWASAMAIHTRWRWPPDRAEMGRVPRWDSPVARSARRTSFSSCADQRLIQDW